MKKVLERITLIATLATGCEPLQRDQIGRLEPEKESEAKRRSAHIGKFWKKNILQIPLFGSAGVFAFCPQRRVLE